MLWYFCWTKSHRLKIQGVGKLNSFCNGLHGIMWEKTTQQFLRVCELSFLPTRSRFCGKKHIGKSKIKTAKKPNPQRISSTLPAGYGKNISIGCAQVYHGESPSNANSTLGTVGVEHLIRCLLPWLLRSLRTLIWRKMTVGTRTPKLPLTKKLFWVTWWIIQKP